MRIPRFDFLIATFFTAATPFAARADYCPKTTSTNFEHSLSSKVTYDKKTKLYTYQYTVSNSRSSLVPIVRLNLVSFEEPKSIPRTPKSDWFGDFSAGIPGDLKSEIQWSTTKSTAPKNPKVREHSQLGMPDEAIQPGKTRSDFTFTSLRPPGIIQYYIDGYAELAVAIGDGNNDDPDLNCPNIDLENPYDRTKITGMTVGPADPSVVQLELRLRKKDSHERFEFFDIKKASEQVSILIMGSKEFDPSTLNIQSLRFGPDEATAVSSKLVDKSYGGDRGKGNRSELKNLLLTFNIKDLGVQCVLDKALFLTGTTKTGKPVFGGVTAKIAGCEVNKPGRRKVLHPR
jgi:hypothetical protein